MYIYISFQVFLAFLMLSKFKYRLFLAIFLLFIFSAVRFDVGYDFLSYYDAIVNYGGDAETFRRFGYLHGLLIKLSNITGFYQLYFIGTSFVFYSFLYFVLRDDSKRPLVSLMVYMAIPFFFLMSFNFIRQFSALVILYYSFRYIYRRDFLRYAFFVFLACSIHYTALITLPLYFLWGRRLHWSVYLALLVSSIFLFPVAKYFVSVLLPGYLHYLMSPNQGGVVFQIFILFVSLVLISLKEYIGNVKKRFFFDVFVLGVVLYNIFQPIGFAGTRISYYFLFSLILLAPYLFEKLKSTQFIALTILLSYLLFTVSLVLHSKVGTRSPSIPYSVFIGKTIDDIRPYGWVKE